MDDKDCSQAPLPLLVRLGLTSVAQYKSSAEVRPLVIGVLLGSK